MARTKCRSYKWDTSGPNTGVSGFQPFHLDPILHAKVLKFQRKLRARDGWALQAIDFDHLKVLAVEENLATNDELKEQSHPLVETLRDIQTEARRIVQWDAGVHLLNGAMVQDVNVDDVARTVKTCLKYLRLAPHSLSLPKLKEDLGVCVADSIVPSSLYSLLVGEFAQLSSLRPRDFAPECHRMLEHLIDPMLYAQKVIKTPASDASDSDEEDGIMFSTLMTWRHTHFRASFSMTPSIFRVSDDGLSVQIASPISGLGPREQHPNLYMALESLFLLALPLLERVSDFEFEFKDSPSVKRWNERSSRCYMRATESVWSDLLQAQAELKEQEAQEEANRRVESERQRKHALENIDTFAAAEDSTITSSWQGKNLAVIVKAFAITPKDGQPFEDWWQHQGMLHERVTACAFYFYGADPQKVEKATISFRRYRNRRHDFPRDPLTEKDFALAHRGFTRTTIKKKKKLTAEKVASLPKDYPSDWEDETDREGNKAPMSPRRLKPHIYEGEVPLWETGTRETEGQRGRMIAFPNWLQSRIRMSGMQNADPGTQPESGPTVNVVCFLLLDTTRLFADSHGMKSKLPCWPGVGYDLPSRRVLTTASLPAQRLPSPLNANTAHILLRYICQSLTGKSLPAEIVDVIYDQAKVGISRAEAEYRRWQMRTERRVDPEKLEPYENDVITLGLSNADRTRLKRIATSLDELTEV